MRAHDGSTALLWAAHWNDLETADLLIRAGADVNAANDLRVTPLSLACTNANAALVERLLGAGANPNTPIATGETPIMTCAGTGSADAVRMLIARGADVNAKEPSQNQTALMWAAAERHADVVKTLIEHGADLQARTKKGFSALHFAAREGDLESRSSCWPRASTSISGRSPLGRAPSGRRPTAAEGGPVARATRRPCLPAARRCSSRRCGRRCRSRCSCSSRAPIRTRAMRALRRSIGRSGTWESGEANPVFGFTDAMSGIPDRQAKLQLVKALLARGANPNAPMTQRPPGFAGGHTDVIGATPFLLASAAADMEMMRLLLAAGADPKVPTKSNMTAIAAATGVNRVQGESNVTEAQAFEVVKFLLELGVDPKAAVSTGENALFGAAYRGWNSVVQLLVDHGADVNAISKSGTTPWRAASGQGDRLGGVLFNTRYGGAARQARRGSDARQAVYGADEMSVTR